MEKINKHKLEKKTFYKSAEVVFDYDYKRFVRGGGKTVKKIEDEIIFSFLKKTKVKNPYILDCPCGTGRAINILKKITSKIICSDTSLKMTNYVNNNYSKIECVNFSAENLRIKKESIDIYLSIRFMFHFENLEDFFSEASRVLKKDGYYVFDVFNLSPRVFFKSKFLGGKTFNHNLQCVKKLSDKHGFTIISQTNCFIIPTYISTFLPNFFVKFIELNVKKFFKINFGTKTFYILKKN